MKKISIIEFISMYGVNYNFHKTDEDFASLSDFYNLFNGEKFTIEVDEKLIGKEFYSSSHGEQESRKKLSEDFISKLYDKMQRLLKEERENIENVKNGNILAQTLSTFKNIFDDGIINSVFKSKQEMVYLLSEKTKQDMVEQFNFEYLAPQYYTKILSEGIVVPDNEDQLMSISSFYLNENMSNESKVKIKDRYLQISSFEKNLPPYLKIVYVKDDNTVILCKLVGNDYVFENFNGERVFAYQIS